KRVFLVILFTSFSGSLVSRIPGAVQYSGNRHHPTEKPVTSLQPLIESFTHPNAIVLDPFAGSGSTCVAALQSGRRYIGIELLEQYHRAGQQRLAAVQRAMQQGAANDDWFMPEAA
ncbi:DNA methyltransferase, partial [Escherichia coli]